MQISRHRLLLICTLLVLAGSIGPPGVLASGSIAVFVEPAEHLSPVLSLIREARQSIRLEVYLLTNRAVVNELGKARQRGVDVRVLLEERPYGAQRYARLGYSALRSAGVNVRWANESAFTYTHEKAMVVDGRLAGIFTFNLSSSGVYSNREFGVLDDNAADARILAAVFDADWSRRPARIGSTRLVISPYNSRRDFDTLIGSARRRLDVYAEEVNDGAIESRLIGAERRHVRVRLITSAGSAGVTTLRDAGIAVTIMASPYVHAKAMVADGSRLFIGSENISATSLDKNREAGILLNDAREASVVESTFDADWSHHAAGGGTTSPPPVSTGSGFHVRVSASPSSVSRGQRLTITAATIRGASCTIRVTYPDGYVSRAASLQGSRAADLGGQVTWSWRVGSTVTGTARAGVTCRLGGKSGFGSTTFEIR